MANFQLRDVDSRLWGKVSTRAQLEGWPLRELILTLLEDYASGRTRPSKNGPMGPKGLTTSKVRPGQVLVLKFQCPVCNKAMEAEVEYRGTGYSQMGFYAVPCPHCGKITERALPGDLVDTLKPGGNDDI